MTVYANARAALTIKACTASPLFSLRASSLLPPPSPSPFLSLQAEMLADDEDADDSWALRRQESEESQGEEHVVGDESGHSEDASTRTKEPSGQGSDDEVEEALGKLKV